MGIPTEYRGYNIEEYWLPQYAKYEFYLKDDCDASAYFSDSIEEAKKIIDELLDD